VARGGEDGGDDNCVQRKGKKDRDLTTEKGGTGEGEKKGVVFAREGKLLQGAGPSCLTREDVGTSGLAGGGQPEFGKTKQTLERSSLIRQPGGGGGVRHVYDR